MMEIIKTKKGLDLPLTGEAERTLSVAAPGKVYAMSPGDFHGLAPRLVVKEGEAVKAGAVLWVDKATERICVVSPVAGRVKAIVRGERRKLLRVEIEAANTPSAVDFGKIDEEKTGAEELVALLQRSGLFSFFRQRPYDIVPEAGSQPKAIAVSAFSKMPLAADFSFVAEGQDEDFRRAVGALAKIAPVYIGVSPEQEKAAFVPTNGATIAVVSGPNPSGNAGVLINHLCPVNKGEVVWTLGAEEVIFIGRLLRTGRVDLTRRVAVAGSMVKHSQYVAALVGAPLSSVLASAGGVEGEGARLINGNPLVGSKAQADGYLAARATEVCVIPEGDTTYEVLGWIAPRLKDFSQSRSYFSWLFPKHHAWNLDCRIKGGRRHMIMSNEYERYFPMDILPDYLIKAILTGDIDRQEALGIYEVAPEDFAVAEFADSSKLPLQHIVREALDKLRKENA